MLRFSLLSSGSSGNAILVASSTTKVLIDNGLSLKQVRARAAEIGETLEDLSGVLVTHEHADHAAGVGVLARKLDVPVHVTQKTFERFPITVGPIPRVEFFEAGDSIAIDGLAFTSYSVCHDAVDPVSFVVQTGESKLGIASDLGRVSSLVKTRLEGSHALILESNYCPDMLRSGPYPPALQQRIRGDYGHLSNRDMHGLLAGLVHKGLQIVVLAHLSQENNLPELARDTAAKVLERHSVQLHVAHQDRPTPMFEIGS